MQIDRPPRVSGDLRSFRGVADAFVFIGDPLIGGPNEDAPGKASGGATPAREGAEKHATQTAHGPVLIVEDDTDIRESLVEIFEENGYRVIGARDGVDAFAKIRHSPMPPCLIVLDLMMPNMDGWTFREEQLRRPSLAAVPVVVMSANREVATARASAGLEAVACLPKPLDVATLLRIVKEHCAPHVWPPAEE